MDLIDISTEACPHAFAIVSPDDFSRVSEFKWRLTPDGYAIGGPDNRTLMHRFIMQPAEKMVVDHINGFRADNRRSNLRICSFKENTLNKRVKRSQKTSKYKGVCWESGRSAWRAGIQRDGQQINIGRFGNELHAAMAYDIVAEYIHGQYAKTNKSLGILSGPSLSPIEVFERQLLCSKKSSLFTGVSPYTHRDGTRVWQARIMINRKSTFLGLFDTEKDAAKAYRDECKKHQRRLPILENIAIEED